MLCYSLINDGGSVNDWYYDNQTSLSLPAANGEDKVCNAMLYHNSRVHIFNNSSQTPPWVSAKEGHANSAT